ncbi:MAG: metallophosphoesterase [Anaerolineae bacterium]|nr:metallophosphoesterase [Anaerolineae bacterium]MDQ7033639.1 metallophosphoesterase [Anaerolineae bacterium]
MRLALISDIHGNFIAFEAMLHDLQAVGEVDLIWCLGDLALGATRPAECMAKLHELQEQYGKDKFKVIGGNTDRYIVTNKRPHVPAAKDAEAFVKIKARHHEFDDIVNWTRDKLSWEDYDFLAKTLGRELRKNVAGYGTVIGYHAIPGDDEPVSLGRDSPEEEALDALLDRSGRLAIGGHTHLVMDRILGKWRAINPGSVGLSFTDINKAEWALITFEGETATVDFRTVPYDVSAMMADMAAVDYPHPAWLRRFVK